MSDVRPQACPKLLQFRGQDEFINIDHDVAFRIASADTKHDDRSVKMMIKSDAEIGDFSRFIYIDRWRRPVSRSPCESYRLAAMPRAVNAARAAARTLVRDALRLHVHGARARTRGQSAEV